MHSSLAALRQLSFAVRLALLAALTVLLSGWTCNAFFSWGDCKNEVAQAQLSSLLPDTISAEASSLLLTVEGSGFTPESKLLWNGSLLETTFLDAHHLQTTITPETLDSFGGSAGSTVLISVRSQGWGTGSPCQRQADSAPRTLSIQ